MSRFAKPASMKPLAAALASLGFAWSVAHAQQSQGATVLNKDVHPPHSATLTFAASGGHAEQAGFALRGETGGLRTYAHTSTMATREDAPSSIVYGEVAGQPVVRSGNLAFDALFAHAVSEMKENAVSAIRDDSYNDGKPIPCECFETGEKWHYVWTRDLSYAAALGLAMLDPQRVRNSLEFKLSGYRPGVGKARHVAGNDDGLQVVQDTGSGGSWPVSSDRVSWAFGADEVLKALPPAERAAFAVTASTALANTIENDRLAAFDARDGLYTGEQSFLDWREQTYGADIAGDLARMASAKALSTNVAHYKALTLAAALAAEQGDADRARRYGDWARQLKDAINTRFWLEDAGMYASLTAAHFDGAPLRKFDWLGQALAIVTGVADADRRDRVLASYPHGPAGAPVIYPQQQGVPVYHNRAIWPFVTAFGLDAAVAGENVGVADAAYASLVRGAALHLSNMENMEWLSGKPILHHPQDSALDGPVINSRRQLWSVGGYLGMVIRNVFGVTVADAGLHIRPFVTARLRRELFADSGEIVLDRLHLRGKELRVRIVLPPAATQTATAEGYYRVAGITVGGKPAGSQIPWEALHAGGEIEVRLGELASGRQDIRRVDGDPLATDGPLFAPFEASIASVARNARGQVELRIADTRNRGDVYYRIYHNGRLAADRVQAPYWVHPRPSGWANCYAVEAVSAESGNASHHSAAVCAEPGTDIPVTDARVRSSVRVDEKAGVARISDWGAPGDRLAIQGIDLHVGGHYAFQLRYVNTGHAINTGISNGVKVLAIKDVSGRVVAQRVVQMPHIPPESVPMYSTPAEVVLGPGRYTVDVLDFYNMSYLSSNALYGAGGGKGGPLNRVDLYGLRIRPLE